MLKDITWKIKSKQKHFHLKIISAKWQPFCSGFNMLNNAYIECNLFGFSVQGSLNRQSEGWCWWWRGAQQCHHHGRAGGGTTGTWDVKRGAGSEPHDDRESPGRDAGKKLMAMRKISVAMGSAGTKKKWWQIMLTSGQSPKYFLMHDKYWSTGNPDELEEI